ncbi:collagen-like protein, partial [Pseudomonas gingeri]|nr:collagen-like protein [Pseudomonas gingeri]
MSPKKNRLAVAMTLALNSLLAQQVLAQGLQGQLSSLAPGSYSENHTWPTYNGAQWININGDEQYVYLAHLRPDGSAETDRKPYLNPYPAPGAGQQTTPPQRPVAQHRPPAISAPSSGGGQGVVSGPQGPQGERGNDGATGPQGPQGDRGQDGATGPQGSQGERGKDGQTGPKGPKGDRGQDGATGP